MSKTKQMQGKKCNITGGDHETVVARQRGKRTRLRCVHCGQMGRWQHEDEQTDWEAAAKDVETKQSVAAVTGKPIMVVQQGDNDYTLYTVSELRTLVKEKGITGYSKMKRNDLIGALNN